MGMSTRTLSGHRLWIAFTHENAKFLPVKALYLAAASLVLAGCVTSSVVAIGPQSYTLSATRCGLCEPVNAYATEQAGKYCVAQGRYLIVRNISGNNLQPMFPGSATINFSCVTEDDPEYQRPNMRKDDGVLTINH